MKFCAITAIHTVDGEVYSSGGPPPSAALLGSRTLRTIRPGELVTAADVGGGKALEALAAAELIAPEGSGDVRIARDLEGRRNA